MTRAERHEVVLREHLRQRPAVRALLERLCDLWDRQGKPPRRLSLDTALARHDGLGDAQAVFGSGAVRSTRAGAPVAIDMDAFLARLGEGGAEAWGTALHRALERQPRNRSAERTEAEEAFTALLATWRESYSAVATASAAIEARREGWLRRLAGTSAATVDLQWAQWGQTLAFLARADEPVGLAELGARFYGSSKALRPGEELRLLVDGLAALEGVAPGEVEPRDLLRRYGICDNPTALKVTVFGPLRLRKRGRWYDWVEQVHALGEAATLSLGNLEGVDAIECAAGPGEVYSSENETPFCRLVREGFPGVLLYTEGYPNAAVRRLLRLLPASCHLRHWGDSDLDGLRIAALLAEYRPLSLWRCNLAELERSRPSLQPLSDAQRHRAERWCLAHPGFRFRPELEFTLAQGWLEQEGWVEPGDPLAAGGAADPPRSPAAG